MFLGFFFVKLSRGDAESEMINWINVIPKTSRRRRCRFYNYIFTVSQT